MIIVMMLWKCCFFHSFQFLQRRWHLYLDNVSNSFAFTKLTCELDNGFHQMQRFPTESSIGAVTAQYFIDVNGKQFHFPVSDVNVWLIDIYICIKCITLFPTHKWTQNVWYHCTNVEHWHQMKREPGVIFIQITVMNQMKHYGVPMWGDPYKACKLWQK